jgi:hypothetical protein
MPRRVFPSQIVDLIDQHMRDARYQAADASAGREVRDFDVSVERCGAAIAAMLTLIDQMPDELLVLDGKRYAEFVMALEAVRSMHLTWRADRESHHVRLRMMPGMRLNPVAVIREALATCPDEFPDPKTCTALAFIGDVELRRALLLDYHAVNQALANGEWKATTILAGSLIEALLLYALQQPEHAVELDRSKAANRLLNAAKRYPECAAITPRSALEYGQLGQYLDIATEIADLLKADTRRQAEVAREFRNLIHPGRTQRLGQQCDRGTALAAVGALEHVVRDLSANTASGS